MLISATIGNWRSHADESSISMRALPMEQEDDRIPVDSERGLEISPVLLSSGGKAGLTDFVKALGFAKSFIASSSKGIRLPIPMSSFIADKPVEAPASFDFVILADETFYAYSFSTDEDSVYTEKLSEIGEPGCDEIVFYERQGQDIKLGSPLVGDSRVEAHIDTLSPKQLFLVYLINIPKCDDVYRWFSDTLQVVLEDTTNAYRGPVLHTDQDRTDIREIPDLDPETSATKHAKIIWHLADTNYLVTPTMSIGESKVYAINGFASGVNSLVAEHMLNSFLESCADNTRTQMILVTEHMELLDSAIVRPDEILRD